MCVEIGGNEKPIKWQQKIPGGKLGVEPGGKPSGLKEPLKACKTLPDHDRLDYID